MVKPDDLVVSLRDVDRDDTLYVGGKGANLGEMIEAKFPVPPGFVITAHAYRTFLKENHLDAKIEQLLATVNFDRQESLNQVSKHIKSIIARGIISEKLVERVFDHYQSLGQNALVAIRSSATSEDSKTASFAGQNVTFLNVWGEANVIEKVKAAWASLFEPRSIFYRHEKKIPHSKTAIALVVQKMVESDASGVIFTVDPVTGDKTKIILETIFGLGEYIVGGKVTPDHFEVDKKTGEITRKVIAEQKVKLVRKGGKNVEVRVSLLARKRQKISDREVIALSDIAAKIEKHYYFPQDIEWAKEGSKLFIVQTRPITTLASGGAKLAESKETSGKALLTGDPASPGIGVGPVKKILSRQELSKIKPGDVLVAKATNPDFVPVMKKSAAIITEQGGRTSHAAIVAREFGIPAVVGAAGALKMLRDNEIVTVNGKTGEIFKGGFLTRTAPQVQKEDHIKTVTKLYVNIADPDVAVELAQKNVDGIGLLRAEFMIAQIGVHPKKLIHDGKSKTFIDTLSSGLSRVAKAFYPRPVLYRATDFKTNEYRDLKGGRLYEKTEANPMLGYRGAYRYIRDAQVFDLELEAIKRVRRDGGTNLNLMVPFVRTVRELGDVKKMVLKKGFIRGQTFKLFMMVEVPSNVILIDDFIETGIDGVSIGSNDLTMLTLGVDRDNSEMAGVFDERDSSVRWSLERVIKACRKHHIASSICGQAPSVYPSLVEDLVDLGIDSISVSPDAVDSTRRFIYRAEERLLKKGSKHV